MHTQITNHRQRTQTQNPHCYRIPSALCTNIILPTAIACFQLVCLQEVQMYKLHTRNLSNVAKQLCSTAAAFGCWIWRVG